MRTKKIAGKLDLNKVTIVSLHNETMNDAKGGVIRLTIGVCTMSCTQDAGCDSWNGCNTYGWCTIPK